jgi:hypothetical protein
MIGIHDHLPAETVVMYKCNMFSKYEQWSLQQRIEDKYIKLPTLTQEKDNQMHNKFVTTDILLLTNFWIEAIHRTRC